MMLREVRGLLRTVRERGFAFGEGLLTDVSTKGSRGPSANRSPLVEIMRFTSLRLSPEMRPSTIPIAGIMGLASFPCILTWRTGTCLRGM